MSSCLGCSFAVKSPYSWEQGIAAGAIVEWNDPEYSVFGPHPFVSHGIFPRDTLQLAYSAAIRQTPDGRLSQNINEALDGAALDGASAGSVVLMGMKSNFCPYGVVVTLELGAFTDPNRKDYWEHVANAQLNYVRLPASPWTLAIILIFFRSWMSFLEPRRVPFLTGKPPDSTGEPFICTSGTSTLILLGPTGCTWHSLSSLTVVR